MNYNLDYIMLCIGIVTLLVAIGSLVVGIKSLDYSKKQVLLSKKPINKTLLNDFSGAINHLLDVIDNAKRNNYASAKLSEDDAVEEWQDICIRDCKLIEVFDKDFSNELMILYYIDHTTNLFEYEEIIKNLKVKIDYYNNNI